MTKVLKYSIYQKIMIKSIKEKQNDLIHNFSMFDSWEDKYTYLMDIANDTPQLSTNEKIKSHLVKGCQSNVWLKVENKNNSLYYYSDSDAPISKGLAALFCFIVNGNTAKQILHFNPTILTETKLIYYLSPTRQKGALSIIERVKKLAKIHE